jgi:hypothetical protein
VLFIIIPALAGHGHKPIPIHRAAASRRKIKAMKIAMATINEDTAGTVLHAVEVTQDVPEIMKESDPEIELEESELESKESEPEKTGKTETCVTAEARRSKEAAKTSDASNAIQPARVFEDAEYFGAKFESFWNRLFSCYCAYDENSEFALPPNSVFLLC